MDCAGVFLWLKVPVKFQMSPVEHEQNQNDDVCEKKSSGGNEVLFGGDMTSDWHNAIRS